ncbi:MAG: DNA-binding response regulator [Anaerolineaceae bacterium]|nr:DNA-binding response regulator [Anaerolineaceae bacterium]
MTAQILVVEDDSELADYLHRGLTYDGYHVRIAQSAEAGMEEVQCRKPDLIILDLMLPYTDGITACSNLRDKDYRGPILMLTARNTVDDRVLGLDAGADDYLVKPFDFEELLARLRALLRRKGAETSHLSYDDIVVDIGMRLAFRRDQTIHLSKTEYDLLVFLLTYPEQVHTRELLIEKIRGNNADPSSNVLDIYVHRLRHKLGEPPLIHTMHGVGYILKR